VTALRTPLLFLDGGVDEVAVGVGTE